ncbi:MAG: benzoate-CoA ligase family protein [Pseudomonadota bacterium]|nr:benzoate-CoA ligase family protein [Pseudomonadota bacterium]
MSARYNAYSELISPVLESGMGDRTAYIDDNGSQSFQELENAVVKASQHLLNVGIRENERLLIAMLDRYTLPVAFLACIRTGIVPILANTLLTEEDYQYILEDSGAKTLATSPELLNTFLPLKGTGLLQNIVLEDAFSASAGSLSDDLPAVVYRKPDDPCFWLYSSGSTGRPKGTVHKQSSMNKTAAMYAKPILTLQASDIIFSAAKLFFAYGLGNSLSFPMSVGATTILMSDRPTPESVFHRLVKHQVTIFFGVPTLYAALLAHDKFPKKEELNLRLCISAGEPLPEDIGLRWKDKTGLDILDGIGSTEMLHIFLSNRPGQVRYGTTGFPVPGYELRIIDENGKTVDNETIGELQVKGPTSAIEYWNQPTKSKSTFLGDWTKTGDKYKKNEDGFYIYCGRSDDMLKVGGIYVSPTEVESSLMKHPAVFEAAVVGRKDEEGLVKPEGFLVINAGYSRTVELKDEIKSHVKNNLAPYKYPRWINFVEELPKTATGKIRRYKLRQASDNGPKKSDD